MTYIPTGPKPQRITDLEDAQALGKKYCATHNISIPPAQIAWGDGLDGGPPFAVIKQQGVGAIVVTAMGERQLTFTPEDFEEPDINAPQLEWDNYMKASAKVSTTAKELMGIE